MELRENTLVAERFRLTRMIGRGGMGSVWSAQDCRLDNQCAIKFIEGEFANIADAQARFEREAKAAAQLRSPHVVEIKDYGVWEGRPYIAMELLDGEDLGKRMAKSGGKLPPAEVNSIIQQVCRALTKAHAAGIVHRDLKPDNIFIVNDDDRQLVKILDFGVAKSKSNALDGSNTKTGAMLGTPYYMSPEQAQGIKTVDSRSDLWSLAVIVYHCITGSLPFDSEALGDLLVKIIVNPIPVPSQVGPVPPAFDRWWAKAADRNVEGRFQTAKDFANELALALGATIDAGMRFTTPAQLTGTAMMVGSASAPGTAAAPAATTSAPFGNTPPPQPGRTVTPNPHAMNTPQPHVMPGNPALARSGLGPPPNTPPPSLNSANPATFSGVEPPFTIPKKGPPLGLIAGGAAAILAIVIGSAVVLTRKPASTTTTASGQPSVSATATTSPVESAAVAATAAATPASDPAPASAPTPTPDPPASAGSDTSAAPTPSSTATTATAPSTPVGAAHTAAVTGAAPVHGVTHATTTTAKPATTPGKTPPAASAKKFNLGF
jgi:serine/threonine-protein kinase